MRRIIILGLLSCLLELFPGLTLAQTLTSYEYWFDDDVEERHTGTLSGTNDAVTFHADARELSQGVHRLNFRAKQSNGSYSAVTSSAFIKIAAGVANKLEYWIDDDIRNARTIEGSLASDGEDYIFNKDLDMRSVSPGMHRLNLRTRSSSGHTMSAITTADFIKISTGTANLLEYWIDGNRSMVHTIEGSASDGNSYVFVADLDLGEVTPGYHRLYYRAVSSTDLTASAVSMTPIIVKSRYYHDPNEPVTVDQYGIVVDNGEIAMYDVANPREIITQIHYLDASKLSPGNHTVKATFWNSLDANVSVEQAFNVTAPEEPSITLTAQQEGGMVKLHFNSVANDKGYRLYRTLGNGTPKIVNHKTGSVYPSDVDYNDNPAAGTYKYQAWISYTDRDGNSKVLKSNELSVTVTKALTEEEAAAQYGTVTGRIVCDKNTPTSGLMVRFSNDDKTVPVQGVIFVRDKMPQGDEVTLTVEGDETHEYEPVTVTVGKGTTDVTIHGTWLEEFQPNNRATDLVMASDLEMVNDLDATYLKFTVKNLSQDHWWYGKVRVRAIDKKKADKMHMELNEMEYGSHNMFTGESERISLKGNAEGGNGSATAEVTITLEDLHLDKSKDFYLYFESVGLWGGEGYTEEVKPITPNLHYNVDMNPYVLTIPKTESDMDVWDNEAKETFAYLALAISCVTPGMSGLVGDLSPLVKDVLNYTGQTEATEAAKVIADWFENTSALEALNEPNVFNITSTIKSYMVKNVHNKIKKPLIERFWRKVGGNVANSVSASLLIKEMRNIATAVTSDDPFEQSMACAKMIYQGAFIGQNAPLSSMMYTYTIVGKALVEKALSFGVILHDAYLPSRVLANRLRSNISDVSNCNTTVNYKVIVKDNGKVIDFTDTDMQEQIDYIVVKGSNMPGGEATFHFDLDFRTDGIVLKCMNPNKTEDLNYIQPIVGGGTSEVNGLTKFEMEIYFENGHVAYIPLIEECDGVKIERGEGYMPDFDTVDINNPSFYTVTLTTATGAENMADEIYLGNNKKRE